MLQTHKAGEKAFIDYAGTTVSIYDSKTGSTDQAQIFVMTLGVMTLSTLRLVKVNRQRTSLLLQSEGLSISAAHQKF